MVITSALPGQEEGNVGYVVTTAPGCWLRPPRSWPRIVKRAFCRRRGGRAAGMARAAARLAKPNAASDIARLILATLGAARQA